MRHGFSLKNLSPKKSAWKSPALWAGIGLGITGAIALALAPKKGKALRAQVKEKLAGSADDEKAPVDPEKASPLADVSPPNPS